jgi:hypothetical protein
MKNFKSFIAVMLVLLMSAGVAFAGWTLPESNSNINATANGGSKDFALSGSGNDGAIAFGGSNGSFQNIGSASIKGYFIGTTAVGFADATGATGAVAGHQDTGNTSMAGGAVGTIVAGSAGGVSGYGGFGKGEAINQSFGYVEGCVFQANQAKEVGYANGEGAVAFNASGASFAGNVADYSSQKGYGIGGASSGVGAVGMAGTAGGSIASVDPGKSSFAATGSVSGAAVLGADQKITNVYGAGGVQTFSNNGVAQAGGIGTYSYQGGVLGAGASVMKSEVSGNGTSFSAKSSGASFSGVVGGGSSQNK